MKDKSVYVDDINLLISYIEKGLDTEIQMNILDLREKGFSEEEIGYIHEKAFSLVEKKKKIKNNKRAKLWQRIRQDVRNDIFGYNENVAISTNKRRTVMILEFIVIISLILTFLYLMFPEQGNIILNDLKEIYLKRTYF